MKKVLATIAVLGLFAGLAHAQSELSLQDGGENLVLTNKGTEAVAGVRGLEIVSAGNHLNNSGAGSFGFVLGNTAGKVTLGALADVAFAPGAVLTTGTTYSGPKGVAEFAEDLDATRLGVGTSQVPVTFPVPEPATGLMAAFAVLGLLGIRRRR